MKGHLDEKLLKANVLQAAGVSAAAVGFGGVLSACASDSGSGSSDKGATSKSEGHASQVTVSMPVSSEPAAGFDPFVSWGCGEHVHEPLIQSTLLTTTADMGFENDLATAYSCSDDGLTWTFTIRTDAKFTNGKALTAHDVAYTINGVANSEASECDLTMVDKAVAVDDETMRNSSEQALQRVPVHVGGYRYRSRWWARQ